MAPKLNPPSLRFPFNLEGVHPGTADAIRSLWNGFTVHEQAFAALGAVAAPSTSTTLTENVTATAAGVTSFNSATGAVSFFPSLGVVNDQSGQTAYITQTQDNGAYILLDDAAAIAVSLNFAVSKPWYTTFFNQGASAATLTPTQGDINGGASFSVPGGNLAIVAFDGMNWWAATAPSTTGTAGVTQIVAGSNVTVSPGGGTGVVTVNASGTAITVNIVSSFSLAPGQGQTFSGIGTAAPTAIAMASLYDPTSPGANEFLCAFAYNQNGTLGCSVFNVSSASVTILTSTIINIRVLI